jgi:hypothetical protein
MRIKDIIKLFETLIKKDLDSIVIFDMNRNERKKLSNGFYTGYDGYKITVKNTKLSKEEIKEIIEKKGLKVYDIKEFEIVDKEYNFFIEEDEELENEKKKIEEIVEKIGKTKISKSNYKIDIIEPHIISYVLKDRITEEDVEKINKKIKNINSKFEVFLSGNNELKIIYNY